MPAWVSAAIFAILVVVFPYTVIFRMLLQLPPPIALSHRRWPLMVNLAVTAGVTVWVAVFIRAVYYHRGLTEPAVMLMDFVIAALAYAFGLAKNHAFVDGNKRIAFTTAVMFLELNGYRPHRLRRLRSDSR